MILALSPRPLGAFWVPLGACWGFFGSFLTASWGPRGILEASWPPLGAPLGALGALAGPSRRRSMKEGAFLN
eukprot:1123438-Pyramimonas_sp.AAC.1